MYEIEPDAAVRAALPEQRGSPAVQSLPGLRPERFLEALPVWPRGFWQRRDRWIAYAGEAARIRTFPGGETPAGPAGEETASLLAAVRERAEELRYVEEAGSREPPLRFHGGVAFAPGRTGRGPWAGFGDVDFVLPLVEADGDREGAVVRASPYPHAGGSEGDDPAGPRPSELLSRVAAASRATWESDRPDLPPVVRFSREVESEQRWHGSVTRALRELRQGRLRKVVLARTMEVELARPPNLSWILRRLRKGNPHGYVFWFEPEPGKAFFGAAPELLGCLQGSRFHATAVAGTIRRGADAAEDASLAHALLASGKDRQEHQVGVDDIRERLARVASGARVDARPRVVRLNRVQHLRTDLRLEVPGPRHILSLIGALHPTAAVCGYPRETALEILLREEPFDRGWYAAPVGWFDTEGNGVFAPALRSAVLQGTRLRLFAGAGIVDGSEPDREWEETRWKFGPILQLLDLPTPR